MPGSVGYVTSDHVPMSIGRVVRAGDVEDADPDRAWLVEDIWREGAVGIIGGPPKSMKSWVALETLVAVASGTPFLGLYEVTAPGPVLGFFAEDSLQDIKVRLNSLCAGRGLELGKLDIDLIDAHRLVLDDSFHFQWLEAEVRRAKPRLLVLDPLVRIFRGNEDDAGQVARVLGLLRKLQRDHNVAVMLVHHARKGATETTGATLRGSGDLHAWGDSNLYLSPTKTGSRVGVEHRSARAPNPFTIGLEMTAAGDVMGLRVVPDTEDQDGQAAEATLEARVLACLTERGAPLGLSELQGHLRVGRSRLSVTLQAMESAGALDRDGVRYRLRTVPAEV